ncbi:MAG: TetR family transcriptional regulator [Myxococcota bacterium]
MDATVSLRERKKARTREALADAARRLFRERGFEATTIDHIAALAEVSRRTFFRYFPTKEDVVFPDRERRLKRFRDILEDRSRGESGIERVRRACLDIARDFMTHRDAMLEIQRVVDASDRLIAYERQLDQGWEEAIAEALCEEGRVDARLARLQAGALMGMVRAALRDWFANGGRDDLVRMGDEAVRLLQDGIGGAPPRKETA